MHKTLPISPRRLLLAGLLALAACGQAPQAGGPTSPAAPTTARPPLGSLGVYELNVTGATTARPAATVRPLTALKGQAQEVGGLSFTPLSFGTFTDEAARVRYLRATFRVTNGSGQALTGPAYVPVDTEGPGGTTGTTPFRDLRYFDGSDASARAADLRVDTPRQVNATTGTIEPDPGATPLVEHLNTGDLQLTAPAGQQVAGVAHQGWQGGALAAGDSQVVTFAVRLPMASSSAQDPFAFSLVFSVTDNPGTLALNNIASVQGQTAGGDAPGPLAGQSVTVEGVVSLVAPGLGGFFLQEEGIDADRDAATSDGLFVFCGQGCPTLSAGDRVRVTGTASEFRRSYTYNRGQASEETVTAPFTVTQLTNSAATVLAGGNALPPAVFVAPDLPVAERERLEGMRVQTTGVVTNNFPLGRFGSVDLAVERLLNYTQTNAPSTSGYAAFLAGLPGRVLRVDDASTAQNPASVFGRGGQPLSAENTLRGGDTGQVTGVLHYDHDGFGNRSGSAFAYRVEAQSAQFAATNPRQAAPADVGGSLRVASMNVLNYFTTLVNSNAGCTPNGTSSASRGANSCDEFARQQAKIVAAIRVLNPDVLGVLEMQNDFDLGANSSVAQLVNALNDPATGGTPGRFAYVNPGRRVGTDAISVALIYQPGRAGPVGQLAILDNSVDPTYTDTCNRPTLAQTFQSTANGGRFTAVMAHLKSKGSACAATADTDPGNGEGNGHQARLNAANAIVRWLGTNPTGVTEDDRLLMGDLNAYRMEAPIQALEAGGYGNLFGPESYSYQFDGQWGSLDHALASASLSAQVTGQTKWHINADEPTVLDYNLEFKTAAQQASLYTPAPFRSSDHDPLLVGLYLTAQTPLSPTAPTPAVGLTPDTDSVTVTAGGPQVTRSFTASGTNTSGDLTVTVTPQNGAPGLVTAPATVTSGAAFDVTVSVPTGTAPGTYTYAVKAENGGASDTSTLTVTVSAPNAGGRERVLISEFRFRGPGGGNDEFIELYNPGPAPVNLGGWKLQAISSSGTTFSDRLTLGGVTVPARGFYLLANGAATGGYSLTPTPDATYGTGVSDNRAIRLVDAGGSVQDQVGFAAGTVCEGTCLSNGPTSGVTAQLSWARNVQGGEIVDTNDNAGDFTARPSGANPQNSGVTFSGTN